MSVVKTTSVTTAPANAFFVLSEIEPGTYEIKETNLLTYPLDVSNCEASKDQDTTDPDTNSGQSDRHRILCLQRVGIVSVRLTILE